MASPSSHPDVAARLGAALDPEGKIARALVELGELAGATVLVLDAADGLGARVAGDLAALGARVVHDANGPVDAVVGLWSTLRAADPAEIAAAESRVRPGGAILAVHHYGRDDVAGLFADRDAFDAWSRRGGPFLAAGFRVRVVHAWWSFADAASMEAAVAGAFGEAGRSVAAAARRPRLAWNVVVYHRRRA
jgi:hypothetical protein